MGKLIDPTLTGVNRTRTRRLRRLRRLGLGLMVTWAILPTLVGQRVIVINTSPSVAPGLYVRCAIEPAVGQLVDFCIPAGAKEYIEARSRQPDDDWYILKPVVAGPGDRVDTTGGALRINGRIVAPMPPIRDGFGNVLPRWTQTRALGRDEYFVFSNRISNSFDSRCYGPVTRREIESVRRPLITW
jgi:conjugative transfer signal peptidase TraF